MPIPAFRFQVQQDFHEIPLGLGVEDDPFDEQMRAFARDYWGDAEELEPLRMLMKAMYAANSRQLAEEGAVYNALGVFPIGGTSDGATPPERVSRCSLLVSVRELDVPDPGLAAAGIAELLAREAGEEGTVQLIALPAGPAVVRVGGSRAVWERDGGANAEEGVVERFFVRVEVWVPFPDEDKVLLLCLSTSDVQDLFMYQAVLADIADTVTFGADDAPVAAGSAPKPRTFG
ncbi:MULTISPECIES: hypothetical protein [unclassified Streptomyces]|uniref:hypothetical protein n=1 Tax=unclassified Streptomyces TaxID=2593676 RepID=UPI0037F7BC81